MVKWVGVRFVCRSLLVPLEPSLTSLDKFGLEDLDSARVEQAKRARLMAALAPLSHPAIALSSARVLSCQGKASRARTVVLVCTLGDKCLVVLSFCDSSVLLLVQPPTVAKVIAIM